MFTDQVILELIAGKGGNGVVAWRREKYLAKGGPFGGDGGKGGSIIIQANSQVPSLDAFRNKRILKAENGQQGGSNNRRGRNGTSLILKVPCGTLVKDRETGEILRDLTEDQEQWEICLGGRGGWGNTHFKSPTNRAPNTASPGKSGQTMKIELELKLIADVGLVGFPNAGKSTLINAAADIPVKMASYPFTTLRPNLGYVIFNNYERMLMADIPGIISGAHRNKGLGHEFLRHIERTKVLLFVIDATCEDPLHDFHTLEDELRHYNPELLHKPRVIAYNKIDLRQPKVTFPTEIPCFAISAITGEGIQELLIFLKRKLREYISPENNAMVAPTGQSSL